VNPLFTRGRLGLFLVAWAALGVNFTGYLVVTGHFRWTEAAVLVLPVSAIFVFFCLASRYPAKSVPLATTPVSRVLLTHLIGAVLLSFIWQQLAKGWAYLLSRSGLFPDTPRDLAPHLPAVFLIGVLLYSLAVAYHYVLLSLEASREAEARVMQSNVLARDAELKALRAQVNPHFLFNSLNSISALTSIDAGRAREMCILLAEFLRMTLGLGEKNAVPLREELGLLQRFLAIEKVRFGERLQVDAYVDTQAESCLVPPLILQPLVENAIVHGIANLPQGGTVRLRAECREGRLHISIENSFDSEAPVKRRKGMGLSNVRQRIEARYPKDATLQVTNDEETFRVQLSIPAEMAVTEPQAEAEHVKEVRR
jgi:two-component system, LytTR family, sensor histidine kinase AlgZ